MRRYIIGSLLLVAVAILIRIAYASYSPNITLSADSYGYYSLGQNIITAPSINSIITPYRMPLYPVFINYLAKIKGVFRMPIDNPNFISALNLIMSVQTILGIIGIVCLFLFLLDLGISYKIAWLFSAFIALDIMNFRWERSLMTEGLGNTLLILQIIALIYVIRKPLLKFFMSYLVLCILGFFLRPAFTILPVLTFPFIAWLWRRNRRVIILCIITFGIYMSVPFFYITFNKINYQYPGIQYVSDITILGRIFELNIPVEAGRDIKYFYDTVQDHKKRNGSPMPFLFLEYYDPNFYNNKTRRRELQIFVNKVFMHNLPQYVIQALPSLPKVILSTAPLSKSESQYGLVNVLIETVFKIYGMVQYMIILIFLWWPIVLIRFFKHPNKKLCIQAILGLIGFVFILQTTILIYQDLDGYGRFIGTMQPIVYLFFLFYVYWMKD